MPCPLQCDESTDDGPQPPAGRQLATCAEDGTVKVVCNDSGSTIFEHAVEDSAWAAAAWRWFAAAPLLLLPFGLRWLRSAR